jgi:ribonuclease D
MTPERPLIQTSEEVEALVSVLRDQSAIAIDTEADSFFHYTDKLCLVQIGWVGGIALLDPLVLRPDDLAPLESVLADARIRKIFHAADYDLYVLQRYGGFKLRSLFDTMISAQLLGYKSVGLAALVQHHFGVELSKDQQRTDWSRRPLRPAQLEYAACDVRYLIELSEILERELEGKRRLAWARREFAALEEKTWPEREFDPEGYLRIKGARQLPPRSRNVLRELFLMRDERARTRDRPPFKILGNGTLMDLAEHPPSSKRGLVGRKGISELVVRRMGTDILAAVQRGLEAPEENAPPRAPQVPGRRRLDRRAEARLDQLKRWRAQRALELGLDPGVFCRNEALEEIANAEPRNQAALRRLSAVKSWWCDDFGQELVELLTQTEPGSGEDPAREPAGARDEQSRTS